MPALPDAAGVIRCVYSGTYGAAKWANVFHMRFPSGNPGQADMNSLATGLRNAWDTNIKSVVNTSCTLTQTSLVDLTSNTGLQAVNSTSSTGTRSSGVALPANTALVVSMKIARRYRGGHPRMYITGQSVGDTSGNTNWTGALLTLAATQFEAWRVACNALTFTSMPTLQLVNLSYYSNLVLRPVPAVDVITGVAIHTRVDTQRRRLGKELA